MIDSLLIAVHDFVSRVSMSFSVAETAAGIGLHVNAHKTEYMCYNQTGDITTQDGASLKILDEFTYPGSRKQENNRDKTYPSYNDRMKQISARWLYDYTQLGKESDQLGIVCDNTPRRPSDPHYISLLKPNYSWPVIHLVVSNPGHYTFLYRYANPNRKGGSKEQTNKRGLGSAPSARRREVYVTLPCSSPCIRRLLQCE